jgi:general L-amino acid transport system permease protein
MTSPAAGVVRAVRRAPMFRDRTNTMATLALGTGLVYFAVKFVRWAVVHAIWTLPAGTDSSLCRATRGQGACWAVIHERVRFVLFGAYPFGGHWRPALACVLLVALWVLSARPACWTPWLAGLWIAVPLTAIAVLRGGCCGLPGVPSDSWGGLPLTFLFSTIGAAVAMPMAVALALGRRSTMPAIRALSAAYIEIVRGVPMITFLFMAAVMFPLFVPAGLTIDKLARAQIAFVMVIAAYLAEVIRAGLQSVPRGQYEAAAAIGFSFWPTTLLIVLPQAIRATIPALVNTFIGFFKDTSLLAIVGLFDLLGAAKIVIVDAKWVGFGVEVYLFVAAIYFVCCYAVSRYSHRLERALMVRNGH